MWRGGVHASQVTRSHPCATTAQGYQEQPGNERSRVWPTVEGLVTAAIRNALGLPVHARLQRSRAARTDRGVSAAASVACFRMAAAHVASSTCMMCDTHQLAAQLNALLSARSIYIHRCWWLCEAQTRPGPPAAAVAPPTPLPVFDPRHSCTARCYEYLVPIWAVLTSCTHGDEVGGLQSLLCAYVAASIPIAYVANTSPTPSIADPGRARVS